MTIPQAVQTFDPKPDDWRCSDSDLISLEDGLLKFDEFVSKFDSEMIPSDVRMVGSISINGYGNDLDILIHVDQQYLNKLLNYLFREGFKLEGGDGYPPDKFESFRNGRINVIVTTDEPFFVSWIRSVEVCNFFVSKCGPINKDDRIMIHKLIMD